MANPSGDKAIAEGGSLPEIVVNNHHLHELADLAWQILTERNDPPMLFQHGSEVAQVVEGESGPLISHLNSVALKGLLDRYALWVKRTRDGGRVPARPPRDVIDDMLALEKPLPRLKGITGTPVFDSQGELCVAEGYQPTTRLLYRPNGPAIPEVPLQPDATDLLHARQLLGQEWLGDFPFADDASRANAIALALTVVAREMIQGPTPMFAVDAPSAGTGKGLLLRTAALLVEGSEPAVMTETANEEEQRKRITSMLVSGKALIQLDNVKRRLESGALEGVLTSISWTDRVLGKTQTIEVPNRSVWLVTGNNLQLGSEMARRTVWTRLDSKEDKPWERDSFRHSDLAGWVTRHRHELIWGLLVLVQNWLSKGRPAWEGKPLGSFEAWCHVIGGVLEAADIRGFLANRQELYSRADQESGEWRSFIERVWEMYHDAPTATATLLPIARELLPGAFGARDAYLNDFVLKTRLGQEFRRRVDRRFGDFFWRAAPQDSHTKAARWAVERAVSRHDHAEDAPNPPATPAQPPLDLEPNSDSFAGDAVVAGVDSESLGQIDSKFVHTEEGGVEPPQAPQPPQTDSLELLGRVEVPATEASTSAEPPQCIKCGRVMSRIRVSDVCGVCALKSEEAPA